MVFITARIGVHEQVAVLDYGNEYANLILTTCTIDKRDCRPATQALLKQFHIREVMRVLTERP